MRNKVISIAAAILAVFLTACSAQTAAEIPAPPPTETPAPTPTPVPTPDPEEEALKALRIRQSEETEFLTLVNSENPLEMFYEVDLYPLGDDKEIDRRCVKDLYDMLIDCTEAGNDPYVCSAYRSYFDQDSLYRRKIIRLMVEDNVSDEAAPAEAVKSVALPGTSEHQLGLAVDIVSFSYTTLDEHQEETDTQKWLMENCWRYGFILRYPNGTSDITGIIYEPWHYRYVGAVAAQAIFERGITLEEYLQLIYPE